MSGSAAISGPLSVRSRSAKKTRTRGCIGRSSNLSVRTIGRIAWLEQLERPEENTVDGYKRTIAYAKEAFGKKPVRRVSPTDVADLS